MEFILTVSFRGECRALNIDPNTSYSVLANEVAGMWNELEASCLNLRYSVGSVSNCVLESDNDLCNLFSITSALGQKIVSVVVSSKRNSCKESVPSICRKSLFVESSVDVLIDHPSFSVDNITTVPSNMANVCSQQSFITDLLPHKSCKKPRLSTTSASDYRGDICVPTYDICPYIVSDPLLSDGWHNLFDGGIGTVFTKGAAGFRVELIKHATLLGYSYKFLKNNGKYIHVECTAKSSFDCGWFIRARCMRFGFFFEIYKGHFYHRCLGKTPVLKRNRFSPQVIGQLLQNEVMTDHDLSGKRIVDIMKSNYGITIPYHKGWRSSEVAKNSLFGTYQNSYNDLRWYSAAVLRTNPGSVFYLEVDQLTHRFQRLFIAFKACLDGFKSCRPMLFLDGTFLSGRAKGTLLTATAKDDNNGLFPVAFAVVSSENTSNWVWFLTKLRNSCMHDQEIFYISDRNCGLMAAFSDVFDKPNHFFCLVHLLANLRGRFGGGIRKVTRHRLADLFREAAYAPNLRIFDEKLNIFKQAGGRVAEEWLDQLPYDKWAVSHAPHIIRFGEMTSNAAESLNAWLKDARGLPITHMLDHIRQDISRWFFERKTDSAEWDTLLCPIRHKMWIEACGISRSWKFSQRSASNFEIKCSPSVVVDIEKRTCSCSQWEIYGFPCPHAAVAITVDGGSAQHYIDPCFLTSTYQRTYMYSLFPIPQTEKYEVQPLSMLPKILPPILKNPPGRPKKCRIKSYGEFPNRRRRTL